MAVVVFMDCGEAVYLIFSKVFVVAGIPTENHAMGVDATSDDGFTLNTKTHNEPFLLNYTMGKCFMMWIVCAFLLFQNNLHQAQCQ